MTKKTDTQSNEDSLRETGTDLTFERIPLSAAQREICVGQLLDPDSPLYNMGMLYTIEGLFNPEKFKACWDTVVQTSDALRMRIHLTNADAMLSVTANPVLTKQLDYSANEQPSSDARNWIQNHLELPMSLELPLVESTLIKISATKWFWYCKQHHIITDATSFAVIWKDIQNLYTNEENISNEPIRSSYLDYIKTQSVHTAEKNNPAYARAYAIETYWQNKSIPPSPTLYGRKPSFTTTRANRNTDFFNAAHAEHLESLLQDPNIRSLSPHLAKFQVLLTVFFAYLYRVSGQSSLAIATTAPNRSNARYANTPGLFVELLPLCVDIETADTFDSLLLKVKAEVLNFLKNTAPGASSTISNRDISAVINYVPLSMDALDGLTVTTQWLHANHMDRQHAVRLHAMDWNNANQVSLALDTNDSCFTPEQKIRAQQHWLTMFEAFCSDRSQLIDTIDFVNDEPLETKPQSSPSLDIDVDPIISRFKESVQRNPKSAALVSGTEQLNFEELALKVDTVAQLLVDAGIGSNQNVAILLPRSLAVPVALLGTLQAQATYVPIEPNNPAERIQHLLDSSTAAVVITNVALAASLTGQDRNLLILDDRGECQASSVLDRIENSTTPNEFSKHDNISQCPAYILYTSGSTGTPKGVVVSRAAMANYCDWAIEYYTAGKQLAFPFFTPLGFDLTVTSLFVPLLSGGSVHIYSSASDVADNSLFKVIEDNRVDIIKLTPAHLSMLQEHNLSDSRVKQLIVGGEDLKCNLAQNIYQAFNANIRIHNEYGPTEATVGCIVHEFNPETDITGSVPIGSPIAGMRALILNTSYRKQPQGVVGDLYVSGPSLANGYWQQPAQTSSEFLSLGDSETIHYRTGDLVRMNENGQLVYMGRLDDQLKIRGARIELAEIESSVAKHAHISNCIIVPVDSGNSKSDFEEVFCTKCGLSSLYPDATIDSDGLCSLCIGFELYKEKAQMYFKSKNELFSIVENLKTKTTAKYDCMMLLSGGKDSSYALAQLVDMGLSVLAYTLDNGYLSTEAKANIKHVCHALEVDHEFAKTASMRKIFAQSLEQFSNVCNGCFKTIYTLSMQRAQELHIPGIFTGLSRGQFFETRLTEELFSNPDINNQTIDATVLSARKAYHRSDDAVSKLLNTKHFQDESIFEDVQVYDFYRYNDVDLDEMLTYLQERLPWVRPKDTGRSTNCLINDVGIHIHKIERGFHNYSLPYSWDVRLGHKNRDAALEELDDDINLDDVNAILEEIGYTPQSTSNSEQRLALYYTADRQLDSNKIKESLRTTLPNWMVPDWLVQLDSMPLNNNGKIDKSALPNPQGERTINTVQYVEASTEIEKKLELIWREQLKLNKIGINDNFFELGGDSLSAIRIAARINESGIKFNSAELFEYQTIAQIARHTEKYHKNSQPIKGTESTSSKQPAAFNSLKAGQLDKLAQVLNKSKKSEI